uniref:Uncharacterized protein n=1 Tax=Nymphaea colorata TaxID=210225 RepID=A0A5K1C065_9MAGN
MRAARALLTHSPSTVPIRTSEFVIDDLLASSRFDGGPVFLCRLQRKDPGCVVGEHMHVLLGGGDGIWFCFLTAVSR